MSLRITKILACWSLLVCTRFFTFQATAEDWPQWRGPRRDGTSPGKPWPAQLQDDSLQQLARIPLGPSYSGPIISQGILVTTATQNRKTEHVYAYDVTTGKELWTAQWEGSLRVPFFAASNGDWIRATPAADAERVYVAGMCDRLVCLTLATGKKVWELDFVAKFKTPLPSFGFVSSPLLVDEALYVQAGGSVFKLNKRTGEVLWRTLEDGGGMWGSAFSSPVMVDLVGRQQLVVQTREKLAGVDPETGAVLWSEKIPAFRGMNILTPVQLGNQLFTSSYGGKSLLLNLSLQSDKIAVSEAWTNKTQGYMSSPIRVGDHLYLHLRNQRCTCIDLKTGKETWTTQPFGKYWSMILREDKILALDERGELNLLQVNPEKFQSLGMKRMNSNNTWGHLAAADDFLAVRELEALSIYRWAGK